MHSLFQTAFSVFTTHTFTQTLSPLVVAAVCPKVVCCCYHFMWAVFGPGLEVIKLEFILRLKIKRNDWLLADTCPQAANHCALF